MAHTLRAALIAAALALPGHAQAPDLAEVTVPSPRQATLLHLRGYSGVGTALMRVDGACHRMPVRVVAGDFGGQGAGLAASGPIRLRISGSAVRALMQGRDLVSDSVPPGGAAVEAGLAPDTGFVINPGRSVVANILGVRPTPAPCTGLDG